MLVKITFNIYNKSWRENDTFLAQHLAIFFKVFCISDRLYKS